MPQIITPSPLSSGVVGDAYSQSIAAEKVVDFVVGFEAQTAEHNQSLDIGEVDLGGEQVEFFVDATPSPDDVFLGAASVSIINEVGCTATVALQPASLVETQSQEPFEIEVTPDTAEAFSFSIQITNDGPDDPFVVDVSGVGSEQTLLEALTTAAGTAPTALWIPGVETFSDNIGTPAGDGDRVYQINDQTGNGYHLREGAAAKGPILRASGSNGIGDKPALDFLRTNTEWMQAILNFNGATPNMFSAAAYTFGALVLIPDNAQNDGGSISQSPAVFGNSAASFNSPLSVQRTDTGSPPRGFIFVGEANRNSYVQVSAGLSYAQPQVWGGRWHYEEPGDKANRSFADKIDGVEQTPFAVLGSLDRALRIGNQRSVASGWLSGKFSVIFTFNVTLTIAQKNAVVDVLRSYAGLAPV